MAKQELKKVTLVSKPVWERLQFAHQHAITGLCGMALLASLVKQLGALGGLLQL